MIPNKKNKRSTVHSPHFQTGGPVCLLTVGGVDAGYFQEATNLGKEYEIILHKFFDGTGQEVVIKLPGRLRHKRVTLKREITSDLSMWEWRRQVELGDVASARVDCTLTAFNAIGEVFATWLLENAWPLGVVSERDPSGVNFEVVTLATESFTRLT